MPNEGGDSLRGSLGGRNICSPFGRLNLVGGRARAYGPRAPARNPGASIRVPNRGVVAVSARDSVCCFSSPMRLVRIIGLVAARSQVNQRRAPKPPELPPALCSRPECATGCTDCGAAPKSSPRGKKRPFPARRPSFVRPFAPAS